MGAVLFDYGIVKKWAFRCKVSPAKIVPQEITGHTGYVVAR